MMNVIKLGAIGCSLAAFAVVSLAWSAGFEFGLMHNLLSPMANLVDMVTAEPVLISVLAVIVGVLCLLSFYRRLLIGAVLFFFAIAASATEVVPSDEGGFIAMLVGALPTLIELTPAWVGVVIGVVYALAHAVAMLPTKFTSSWPSWLKSLINLLAANYGKAKNKDG